ncbi:MAG: hypothetical protein KAJ55_00305 [Anaerolineales bacterium]|nr:hypothetical protein [Anaerolineales bacterium]
MIEVRQSIIRAIGNSEQRRGRSAEEIADSVIAAIGFIPEEIPFLQRADGLLTSHFRESISPTIDRVRALLPPLHGDDD